MILLKLMLMIGLEILPLVNGCGRIQPHCPIMLRPLRLTTVQVPMVRFSIPFTTASGECIPTKHVCSEILKRNDGLILLQYLKTEQRVNIWTVFLSSLALFQPVHSTILSCIKWVLIVPEVRILKV